MGARGLEACAFPGCQPAEPFFGAVVGKWSGLDSHVRYARHPLKLGYDFFVGVGAAECFKTLGREADGKAQPVAPLAHHYETDVDKLATLLVRHITHHGVFI